MVQLVSEAEDIERDEPAFEDRRALDRDLTAFSIQDTLRQARVDSPGAFAAFLAQASRYPCSDDFRQTVATIVEGHYGTFAEVVRSDPDALEWNAEEQMQELGRASIAVGGRCELTGHRLLALAAHVRHGTGAAFLAATSAGLYENVDAPTFTLARKHRDATGDMLAGYWEPVFAAIDQCPTTPEGAALRSDLLSRADAHLRCALADFDDLRATSSYLQDDPDFAAGLQSAYTMIRARLDAQLGRSGPDLGPTRT
jgi:hypothetical protein